MTAAAAAVRLISDSPRTGRYRFPTSSKSRSPTFRRPFPTCRSVSKTEPRDPPTPTPNRVAPILSSRSCTSGFPREPIPSSPARCGLSTWPALKSSRYPPICRRRSGRFASNSLPASTEACPAWDTASLHSSTKAGPTSPSGTASSPES